MWQSIREFFLLTDFKRGALVIVPVLLAVLIGILMFLWDFEPETFDVSEQAAQRAAARGEPLVTGYVTTATLMEVAERLLNKTGGYLTNDKLPPGVLMDNIPNWEYGVVRQIRDLGEVMRNDMSRSQTQSKEDPDLALAAPRFQFDTNSWILPSTESQYREGIEFTGRYLARLADADDSNAQFYARADNLRDWLALVEKRLGDLAQQLANSVGDARVNVDLAGDPAATRATPTPRESAEKTPWLEIDDIFYEARGATWALLHFLKAAEIDFATVLEKKNARASLENIIRALEPTQATVWSPVILNGRGFGFTANHSLVMGSYISRANAAIIELRNLLEQG